MKIIWVEIIFKSSATPKRHVDVTRCYTKGGLLCVELQERDEEGRPVIMGYPLVNVFSVARPHVDHVGHQQREDCKALLPEGEEA